MKKELKKLVKEVKEFNEILIKEISKNEEILELYLGNRIFFSNIIENPIIYLLGINPGGGIIGDDFEPLSKLEYVDEECLKNGYRLAEETREVFNRINRMDILENSTFKTNVFFTTTKRQSDIYKITDFLGRGGEELLGDQVFNNAYKWTKELIEIINPKIIICEGNQAYEDLCYSINIDYYNNRIKSDCIKISHNGCIIIAYKRRWSNIKNKLELASLLEDSLKELNLYNS
jgi:hypothetical protein